MTFSVHQFHHIFTDIIELWQNLRFVFKIGFKPPAKLILVTLPKPTEQNLTWLNSSPCSSDSFLQNWVYEVWNNNSHNEVTSTTVLSFAYRTCGWEDRSEETENCWVTHGKHADRGELPSAYLYREYVRMRPPHACESFISMLMKLSWAQMLMKAS